MDDDDNYESAVQEEEPARAESVTSQPNQDEEQEEGMNVDQEEPAPSQNDNDGNNDNEAAQETANDNAGQPVIAAEEVEVQVVAAAHAPEHASGASQAVESVNSSSLVATGPSPYKKGTAVTKVEDLEIDPTTIDATLTKKDRLTWRMDKVESFSDWTIIVEEKQEVDDLVVQKFFHVHKCIMAIGERRSEYFSAVFHRQELKEHSEGITRFSSLSREESECFPTVLDYIYHDQRFQVTRENIATLYKLADFLQIQSLIKIISDMLQVQRDMVEALCNKLIMVSKAPSGDSPQTYLTSDLARVLSGSKVFMESTNARLLPVDMCWMILDQFLLRQHEKSTSRRTLEACSTWMEKCLWPNLKQISKDFFICILRIFRNHFIETNLRLSLLMLALMSKYASEDDVADELEEHSAKNDLTLEQVCLDVAREGVLSSVFDSHEETQIWFADNIAPEFLVDILLCRETRLLSNKANTPGRSSRRERRERRSMDSVSPRRKRLKQESEDK